MFEFMTKILSDGNFVKIYLTSGESEGVIFGSRDASGRKVRYAVTVAEIAAVREHW